MFRQFLTDLDLTLEGAAFRTGVDRATISRVSRGLQQPRRATIVKLARGLGVSPKRMQAMVAATPPATTGSDDPAPRVRTAGSA